MLRFGRKLLFSSKNNFKSLILIRNAPRGRSKLPNPGIQFRLNLLSESKTNEAEVLNTDILEECESDFMNVSKSHKQHELETKQLEEYKRIIIRQKYFKGEQFNFLFWYEKEQIRYLHNSKPEEWTIDKLAESFPALPDTIKKIIKSQWSPKSENRIKNHDENVKKNWMLYKRNKLDVDTELNSHLKKFSNRRVVPLNNEKPDNVEIEKPQPEDNCRAKTNEFRQIVMLPEKKENKNNDLLKELERLNPTNIDNKKENKKMMTLNEFKKTYLGQEITPQSQMARQQIDNNITFNEETAIDFSQNKNVKVCEEQNLDHLRYPNRIVIPQKLWKRGKTYKVNDCYYNDDGTFLYRVLGMTGQT